MPVASALSRTRVCVIQRLRKACKPKAKKGKRCTIKTTYGTVTKTLSAAGKVTVKLKGKVGRKAFQPGGLRVEVTVRDAAGNKSARAAKSGTVKR